MSSYERCGRCCSPTPGPYVYADVLDLKHLHSIVVNYRIDWVIHFAALLSAIGEQQPRRALDVSYYFHWSTNYIKLFVTE